jgi:hypothetical protein
LTVEIPSSWNEVLTGEDATFEDESVGPSITASTDLDARHSTGRVPGTFILASGVLAERYTNDELLDLD